MSDRYLGAFITATFNPLAISADYLVIAGGGGGGSNIGGGGGAGGSGGGGDGGGLYKPSGTSQGMGKNGSDATGGGGGASGGSAGSSNVITYSKSIAAGDVYTFPELIGHTLQPGDIISTIAGTASALTIRASGREVV